MTTNEYSLFRILPDLQEVVTENKSNIVAVTESWLKLEINDAEINNARLQF